MFEILIRIIAAISFIYLSTVIYNSLFITEKDGEKFILWEPDFHKLKATNLRLGRDIISNSVFDNLCIKLMLYSSPSSFTTKKSLSDTLLCFDPSKFLIVDDINFMAFKPVKFYQFTLWCSFFLVCLIHRNISYATPVLSENKTLEIKGRYFIISRHPNYTASPRRKIWLEKHADKDVKVGLDRYKK